MDISFLFFLLKMNFEKSTIRLYVLLISSILVKFLKKSKINSYVINKLFKLQKLAIYHNIYSIDAKFEMCIKSIKNIQSNS